MPAQTQRIFPPLRSKLEHLQERRERHLECELATQRQLARRPAIVRDELHCGYCGHGDGLRLLHEETISSSIVLAGRTALTAPLHSHIDDEREDRRIYCLHCGAVNALPEGVTWQ